MRHHWYVAGWLKKLVVWTWTIGGLVVFLLNGHGSWTATAGSPNVWSPDLLTTLVWAAPYALALALVILFLAMSACEMFYRRAKRDWPPIKRVWKPVHDMREAYFNHEED